jgi:hypothetical protein
MRADVDPLGLGNYKSAGVLGLAVQQSIHGEKTNTAFLVQGGLGLPDREDYLSADPAKTALAHGIANPSGGCSRSPGSAVQTNARDRGAGAGNGDRSKPWHARGVGRRPQRRQRVDAFRLRATRARDGLDHLLR